MTVSSTTNTSLSNISSGYTSTTAQSEETEDTLGREEFLTLLVAQLENQDPLSPQEEPILQPSWRNTLSLNS